MAARGGVRGSSLTTDLLYKIATNICVAMKRAPQRRCLPMDLSGPEPAPDDPTTLALRPEPTWVGPIADSNLAASLDPAATVIMRESIRLAFITALQVLPPRQRVVLILRDVLAWTAQECADRLDPSVASMNSALARARKTVSEHAPVTARAMPVEDDETLLTNCVAAFGVGEIEQWWRGPGQICRNPRTIPAQANGQSAVAVYHDVGGGRWEPFAGRSPRSLTSWDRPSSPSSVS